LGSRTSKAEIIMKIALDWDDTVTLNPDFWFEFISVAVSKGFDIRIVTARTDNQAEDIKLALEAANVPIPVIATSLRPKRQDCNLRGWYPNVWIDDSPEMIV
jgi:hypothetical protein